MRVLITGGAGFIGCNAARRLAGAGHDVLVLDNFSRRAAPFNRQWMERNAPSVEFLVGDIRSSDDLRRAVAPPLDAIIHLAGQVAVTTSIEDPVADWEANAVGSFRLLEAVRERYGKDPASAPLLLYSSTNKVYGHLTAGEVLRDGRWDLAGLTGGISEREPLSFESPYGCSKGAADQYVIDYRRSFGLATVVFRQSCIYGTRQFGEEDQGWVAWFALAASFGLPITLYGDGLQVRDLLWVDDLVDAYVRAIERKDRVAGRAYNIGGGPGFRLSLKELIAMLERRLGRTIEISHADSRLGDQRVFYCDVSRAKDELGWEPRVGPEQGVERLLSWIAAEREEIARFLSRKGVVLSRR